MQWVHFSQPFTIRTNIMAFFIQKWEKQPASSQTVIRYLGQWGQWEKTGRVAARWIIGVLKWGAGERFVFCFWHRKFGASLSWCSVTAAWRPRDRWPDRGGASVTAVPEHSSLHLTDLQRQLQPSYPTAHHQSRLVTNIYTCEVCHRNLCWAHITFYIKVTFIQNKWWLGAVQKYHKKIQIKSCFISQT